MKNQNTNETVDIQIEATEKADSNRLVFNVAKVVLIGGAALLSLAGAQAMFTDHTLTGLEASLKSSITQYEKLVNQANTDIQRAEESKKLVGDAYGLRCSIWKATKSYKESKQIKLDDPTYNPCTEPNPFSQPEQSQAKVQ